jgi:hypothetical protein
MKHMYLVLCLISILIFTKSGIDKKELQVNKDKLIPKALLLYEKDTCMIEGQAFRMKDYRSTRVMRAYIKNSQLYVVNEGLTFAKYRIIQYVFSSLTNEYVPTFRAFNQRISPPIIQILKNARVGEQYLFEDIVVVDQSNKILPNEVRPLMIERVKN